MKNWEDRVMLAITALLVTLIPGLIYIAVIEQRHWEAFAVAHECKIVGHMSSSTITGLGVGVMNNGQVGTVMTTSTTPEKTGYACNDGITYWR